MVNKDVYSVYFGPLWGNPPPPKTKKLEIPSKKIQNELWQN